MAKRSSGARHASIKPSEAEKGGDFNFPIGAEITVVDGGWTTWEEAGEKAYKSSTGRDKDDPVLKIVGEWEGAEEPRVVYLSAGKKNRFVPSDDGEFLDIAEGSSANAITESSNANVFIASLCDKKRLGKSAMKEDALDGGCSEWLHGLVFVAGSKVVERENMDEEGRGNKKPRPTLVADQIVSLAGEGDGKKAKSKTSKKSKKDEDDDEDEEEETPKSKKKKPADDDDEDEAPAKKKGKKKPAKEEDEEEEEEEEEEDDDEDSDDDDPESLAETALKAALEMKKYKDGVPLDKAMIAIHGQVRELKNAKKIAAFGEDEDWLKSKKRKGWTIDDDDVIQAK